MIPLLLAALAALPQDEMDSQLEALREKLAPDPVTAKLAGLLATEHGRQAVRERVEWLLSARIDRFDRDPIAHYERHLFAPDGSGALVVRPERRDEFALIAREVDRVPKLLERFHQRLDAFASRIADESDLGKRARAMWQDPVFRIAFLHERLEQLAELPPGEELRSILFGKLAPDAQGRLRVPELLRPHLRGLMDLTHAQLEMLQAYERAYLRAVTAEKDEAARTLAASEAGTLFLLGRLSRQVLEGAERSIGGLQESEEEGRKGVSFNLPLADFAPDIRGAESFAREAAAAFEKAASELAAEEADLAAFLRNGRARFLVAERVLARSEEAAARAEAAMEAVREDGFEERDGRLLVRKGRYVDENGADSADALEAEHRKRIDGFFESRLDYNLIAERCADPGVAGLFSAARATFVVRGHVESVIAMLRAAARQEAVADFGRLYLEKSGDALAVRPARAASVEELVRRAAEIRKEKEGM
jgi:hypothetical protein